MYKVSLPANLVELFSVTNGRFIVFRKDSAFNWRKVLYRFNKQIEMNGQNLEAKTRHPKVLILDDSTLAKTGKKIEGVSRVHDHVTNSYPIGYKLRGLTWFNVSYGRFLDFCLVAEKKLKLTRSKKQFSKKRDKKSPGAIRKSSSKRIKLHWDVNY